MGFLSGLKSWRTTQKDKITEALIHDDLRVLAAGLDNVVSSVNAVDITYADLGTLKSTNSLVPNTTYYITGIKIWIKALTTSELSIEGNKLETIVIPNYYVVAGSVLGVWHANLTPIVDDFVVWGAKVWKNLTGSVGVDLSRTQLDDTNWLEYLYTDVNASLYYEDKVFGVNYNFDLNLVILQWDDRNNFITFPRDSFPTDWGDAHIYSNSVGGYIGNNNCGEIANNNTIGSIGLNTNTGGIRYNTIAESIVGNSCVGAISYNTANNISNNNCTGDLDHNNVINITDNSNTAEISYNSCSGSIFNNANSGAINGNSNNGDIYGNTVDVSGIYNNSNNGVISMNANTSVISGNANGGVIYGNSNSGNISNNANNGDITNNAVTVLGIISNSNLGGIEANANSGNIYNNSNLGGIYDSKSTVTYIQNNTNSSDIEANSIVGHIYNNSNNGVISANTQISGTCNIANNNNNGNITGARVADVLGTVVNL